MAHDDDARPVGVVIAAHGDLAGALRRSAEMIVGEQDGVVTVNLDPHDNLENMQTAIREAIRQADQGSGVVVLIDVFGGTPSNAAALCLAERRFPLISGVNLPMLLEVFMSRASLSQAELGAMALASGASGIVDIGARLRQQASPGQST
jgi:PTS system mannose-specific IIA component